MKHEYTYFVCGYQRATIPTIQSVLVAYFDAREKKLAQPFNLRIFIALN